MNFPLLRTHTRKYVILGLYLNNNNINRISIILSMLNEENPI